MNGNHTLERKEARALALELIEVGINVKRLIAECSSRPAPTATETEIDRYRTHAKELIVACRHFEQLAKSLVDRLPNNMSTETI